MIVICVLSTLVYVIAILVLIYGFAKVDVFEKIDLEPKTNFSIIVPFRNEANNLPLLLESISRLNYPTNLFEVILVDDASNSKFQIPDYGFQISIIDNNRISNSPKKDAITTAMHTATNDWVITTDADCVVPENWLLTFDNYIQLNSVEMLAGAVKYDDNTSFLNHFQQLDLSSLQGATMGSFGINYGFMCNGANFGYTRSLFEKLNGFQGNDTIASGDDVFLLQKAIAQFPDKVHYLKSHNAIVTTKPEATWLGLFYQRVRWASKTKSYQSVFGKLLGGIVFLGNVSLLVAISYFFFEKINVILICFLGSVKLVVDFLLIQNTNHFLKSKTHNFIISSLLYPLFCVSVALYSLFGGYKWKGRFFIR